METAVQQHPDIFRAEILGFGDNLVFVQHPEAMRQFLTSERTKFLASGKENAIFKPLVGDYSIFLLEDDRHKKRDLNNFDSQNKVYYFC